MNNTMDRETKTRPAPRWLPWLVLIFVSLLILPIIGPGHCQSRGHRELAKRNVCGRNMKNIGTAVAMYATGHSDVCPPNLEALIIAGQSPDLFICPGAGTEPLQELMDEDGNYSFDLDGHCDYIYIAVGDSEYTQGTMVTLFELPINHGQEAVNIGHLDSHVERYHDFSHMLAKIQQSNDYLAQRRSLKP